MDNFSITVILLVLITAAGVIEGQQTDCSKAQNECQASAATAFRNSSATDEYKCSKAKEALSCINNLTCTSDVTFRALFLVTIERLAALNLSTCDITSVFYPKNISECDAKKQTCLFNYVDDLNTLNKTQNVTDPKPAKCQQLSNYIQCLKNTGSCVTGDSLLAIKTREEEKTAGQKCVVPSVMSVLTLEECSVGVKQCQTINATTNASTACLKSQEGMRCLVQLSCVSDVILRIFHVQTKNSLANQSCDIDSILPLEQKNMTDCEKGRKSCVYPYVERLMTNNSWTQERLCTELNDFMNCTTRIDACSGIIQPKTIAENEITRMKLVGCVVSYTNNAGERSALALAPLVVVALMLSTFMK